MSGDWVSASEAREIVSRGCDDFDLATQAILKSASVGRIATQAELVVYEHDAESRRRENCRLPSFFWPRENFDIFQQDWARSIFSKVDWPIRCHAFGVTFSRAHLEAMAQSDGNTSGTAKPAGAANPPKVRANGAYDDAALVSQEDARHFLGIGRTKLSELISSGQLESVKLGTRRLVKIASLHHMAGIQPPEKQGS